MAKKQKRQRRTKSKTKKYSTSKTVLRLLKVAYKVNRRYFFFTVFTAVIVSLAPVLSSYFLALMLDKLVGAGAVMIGLSFLVAFFCLTIIFEMVAHQFYDSLVWKLYRYDITEQMILEVARKTSTLDMEFFESPKFADLRSNALDTYEWRPADFLVQVFRGSQHALAAILSLVAVLSQFPFAVLIVFISILPSVIADFKMQSGLWDVWTSDTKTRRKFGRLLGYATAEHIGDVKQLGLSKYFIGILHGLIHGIYRREKKVEHKRSLWVVFTSVIPLCVISLFVYLIANDVVAGLVTIGTLSFFVSNMFNLKDKAGGTLFYAGKIIADSKYIGIIFEFLDTKNKIKSKRNAVKIIESPPAIEFKNVYFKYPGTKNYVLSNFDLKVEPGQKIAIVGENGAGKTTMVKLLLRFYDVTKGGLFVGKNNIQDLDIDVLREKCAVLLQDFSVFRLPTLGENVGLGNIGKYEEELKHVKKSGGKKTRGVPPTVVRAAKQAQAHEIIMDTDKGYNTIFARDLGGVDFSGGETQRLALARTFYRDAGLVILDEPTSNVDAKAEAEIFDSLREYLANKTVIFVSHRFSTVRNADRIVVVDEGKIIEDGSHEELMKIKDGLYQKMFTLQAKGYN